MWGIFGKSKKNGKTDEAVRLNNSVNYAFSKIDRDIYHVGRWIQHINDRNSDLEKSHTSHVELTRKELENLARWVKFLHDHDAELQNYLRELTVHVKTSNSNNVELQKRLEKMEDELSTIKGHLRTQDRTSTGQVQDMSVQNQHKKQIQSVHPLETHPILVVEEDTSSSSQMVINKSTLNGAQIELLRVLYEADRPLSYGDLSKILNKKGKSVRNLIYEAREKGINIESRFVGLKKKGFYLTKDQKINLTGR